MEKRSIILSVLLLLFVPVPDVLSQIWLEAEQFEDKGGWTTDPQFIDQMGSACLLAHGLGEPVKPAATTITFEEEGIYHIWVRTRDWAPYPIGPGAFSLIIDDRELNHVFGQNGKCDWHWEYGGSVEIKKGKVRIQLNDLTGFEGRIDALYFSKDKRDVPPAGLRELSAFRHEKLRLPAEPEEAGNFDLVVAGGGIAGICASVQAARLGLKVALIQNRPILGGNSSSEIRLPMMGDIYRNLYPKLGRIVRELNPGTANEIGKAADYGDDRKLSVVKNEKNISLFLSTHVYDVEKEDGRIVAVLARDIESSRTFRFKASLFADCTGDASLGVASGASYRAGRESYAEMKEPKAPQVADSLTLGTTNHWYAVYEKEASDFPLCPWAVQFQDVYHLENTSGAWYWESGFYKDKVRDAEFIRDYNFRVIYGNWSYLKNHKKEAYAHWKLKWMAFIAGKRESRRLTGDIVLSEVDINNRVRYPDACVTTTWGIDLHYPDPENSRYYPGEEFLGVADHDRDFEPYHIPYRCFYSKDIDNLFMAGRNISVSHIVLGTVRVMNTTGMMGEVVGVAAYLCKKHTCTPREIYTSHLSEFIELLSY